jgi:hypothetical protein
MAKQNECVIPADLADLLIDDFDDLPEYGCWPIGAYVVNLTASYKVVGQSKEPAIEFCHTLVEIQEMEEHESLPTPKPGDMSTVLFRLKNEYGLANYKKASKSLREGFGARTIADFLNLFEFGKSYEMLLVTGVRADKNDKTKFYQNIQVLDLL